MWRLHLANSQQLTFLHPMNLSNLFKPFKQVNSANCVLRPLLRAFSLSRQVNGTACAIPRMLIAIIESNQRKVCLLKNVASIECIGWAFHLSAYVRPLRLLPRQRKWDLGHPSHV